MISSVSFITMTDTAHFKNTILADTHPSHKRQKWTDPEAMDRRAICLLLVSVHQHNTNLTA